MADTDCTVYGIIYCVENKESGKRYIGQTTWKLARRWATHCCPTSRCKVLSDAIQSYGKQAFSVYEIDSACSKDELNEKEEKYIALYDTTNRANGYNLRTGGNSSKPSEESRKKMAAAKIGRTLTDEHKAKIGLAGRGRVVSEEVKLKQSIAKLGKKFTAEHIKNLSKPRPNYVMSEKHKDAIRAAATGSIFSKERRKKISEANKGRVKGPLSDETKEKLSLANKGRVRSAEDRQKMSDGRRAAKAARLLAAQI